MEKEVVGQSFTSNHVKLLKHLDKLKIMQDGGTPSPVMVHMSPCNPCNLTCSFCCFANRAMKEMLTIEQMKSAIDQFRALGATGLEFSIKGDEIIPYKDSNGMLKIDTIKNVVDNKIDATSFSLDASNEFIEDRITDWISHPQKEPLYKITLVGGRNITVTKSHSVLFWDDKENKIIKKKVGESSVGDKVVVINKTPSYSEITEYEFNSKKYQINGDFCRLLGFFVAEGSYSYQREGVPHGIVFTFGKYKEEKNYIDDVCSILKDMEFNYNVDYFDHKTNIRVSQKELHELFVNLDMGIGARNKRVPDIIFNVSDEKKEEFLSGLFAGDGCFRNTIYKKKNKDYSRNVLNLKTSSNYLLKTVSYLLDTLSVRHTLHEGVNRIRYIDERRLEESEYYSLDVSDKNSLKKIEKCIKIQGKETSYKDSKFSNNKPHLKIDSIGKDACAYPIKKIEILDDEETEVFDITVGNTHKFQGSFGIFCHNTGGGEPTLHPKFDEAVRHAHSVGFKIGVCTNGSRLSKIKTWDLFSWVRLGMYGWDEGYEYDLDVLRAHPELRISAAYVWDMNTETSSNPNIIGKWADDVNRKISKTDQKKENFFKMIDWVEENKIPTRIAFNAIKPVETVKKDMEIIREQLKEKIQERGALKYAFLSDFNYKGERRNDHCYMHMVKPFVFTDGNVYVCPSSELSEENSYNMNEEFKLCDIDGITDFYKNGGVTRRHHACKFCKYAMQNELVDDILFETENNEFA